MKRLRPRCPLALALAALLTAFGGAGCSQEEPASRPVVRRPVPKEAAKAAEATRPSEIPEVKAPAPVALYSPEGKRDPFVPFIKTEEKAARTDLESLPPLQRFDLGELKFVGVIWGPAVTRALVEDGEGKGYTVTVGTRIGSSGGVVTRITEKEIVVREVFRDYTGGKVERESFLTLQTAGGK